MGKKSFISGAIILMLAGFIVRILGFFYRIYLSNLIGAEGMGLFQLISPVYSLIILTLTSGVSIAVSKMVAEVPEVGNRKNIRRITRWAMILSVSAGTAVSLLIWLNLDFIVSNILKDSRTYWSMLLLIPCIPVIAAASALKGYFYGIQEVTPTAVSQVVEQMVKIGLIVAVAGVLAGNGLDIACAIATVGTALGEIANLLVLSILYLIKNRKGNGAGDGGNVMRKRTILRKLLNITLPISFNRFITSMMSSVETLLIPRALLSGGLDHTASMEELGRLWGMAMPLLFFPSLVTSSLATTLVPAISEALSSRSFKSLNYRISKSIKFTFVLGFLFTAVFMCYSNEISDLIYRKEKIGGILYLLSFTCVTMYVQQTLLGILNGLGKQGISLRNSIIGNTIRIGFVIFAIPRFGVTGYVWGIILSTGLLCMLNLRHVVKATGMALDMRNWIMKPGLVSLAMVLCGKYLEAFIGIFIKSGRWAVMSSLAAFVIIGLLLMFGTGALERKDIRKLVFHK